MLGLDNFNLKMLYQMDQKKYMNFTINNKLS